MVNFWSSIVAGASSTIVTNPIWVIKTRLMSQNSTGAVFNEAQPPWHYRSTVDAARQMYRTEGVLSFYSGLTPSLLGLTHAAVQFPAYEYLKTKFTGQGMGILGDGDGDHEPHWFGILSASVLSKILASSATYPHEVIRTRLQTQRPLPSFTVEYTAFKGGMESGHGLSDMIAKTAKPAIPRYKGIIMTSKTILQEEGWRAFYAGMGTNMIRTVPAITTTLLTYEYVIKYLNHLRAEGNKKMAL
jgi:solute carrier family 25 folate transporter 32